MAPRPSSCGSSASREPTPDPHVDEHGRERGGLVSEVRDGLRYVLGNEYLRAIAACTGTSNFFNNVATATILVYLVRDLGLTPAADRPGPRAGQPRRVARRRSARTASGRPSGSARRSSSRRRSAGRRSLLVAIAPADIAVPFLVASGLLAGFGTVVYNINQVSFRQAITPLPMQGRMNATMRFIVWGTIPVGAVVGGIIATAVSVHTAIWVGAFGMFLAVLPVLLTKVRTLRDMPTPAGDEPTAGAGVADPGATA